MPLKKKNQPVQKIVKKVETVSKTKNGDYVATIGRRKTAVARIRFFRHKGDNLVNGRSVSTYFPEAVMQQIAMRPLDVIGVIETSHFTVKVEGGGLRSQASAVSLGLARALVKVDEAHKKALRDLGLMTRDSRMKETRKMGMGGKARRAKQSPKR